MPEENNSKLYVFFSTNLTVCPYTCRTPVNQTNLLTVDLPHTLCLFLSHWGHDSLPWCLPTTESHRGEGGRLYYESSTDPSGTQSSPDTTGQRGNRETRASEELFSVQLSIMCRAQLCDVTLLRFHFQMKLFLGVLRSGWFFSLICKALSLSLSLADTHRHKHTHISYTDIHTPVHSTSWKYIASCLSVPSANEAVRTQLWKV